MKHNKLGCLDLKQDMPGHKTQCSGPIVGQLSAPA